MLPRFDTYLMYFNDEIYGHSSEYEPALAKFMQERGLDPYPFKLKDITKSIAQDYLRSHGVKASDQFVTLHIREEGYVDSSAHAARNTPAVNFQNL